MALKGMIWSATGRIAGQAGQFVISIVLARLLMPEDFGLIGMLSIFIAISQGFVDSGMGSGLIQKKDRTEVDFSTVFIFNLVVSSTFYLLLFASAPLIAQFYDKPQLINLTRVLSLNIVINALALVQRSRLRIKVDFKTIAKVDVIAMICSGGIAILFALLGFGVWALVIQNIIRSVTSALLLWFMERWRFSIVFSKKSFKDLFGFGSKLLISGLVARIMQNIYNIIIGKVYSASELGFYTRGRSFSELTAGTVSSILNQVTYPILASIQDDKARLVSVYSRLIRMTSFLIFPAMTMLALLADPFIMLFLTEKWAPAIVLLQWMSFAWIFNPISAINLNILNSIGRSDLFMKVDLSKVPIVLIALLITVPISIKAVVIGNVITHCIAFFINAYMPGKLFGYGPISQLKDMVPVFFATGIMALTVFMVVNFIDNHALKLIIGGLVGVLTYILMSYILKINELEEVKGLFTKIRNGKE
ncbi:MAG: lipopolysaccharide biosynthesis protein [Bacteroidota bacterium]|nr:lipopolysaccharide biosynthesis protein [Bacteroidota bacterium]